MTWNSHIRKISNKISRVVRIMNRLKHVLPQSALKLMYDSLINSHLQFCTTAWGYLCNRVTNLQKRALRIMCGAKYTAHTEPLLKGCNMYYQHVLPQSALKLMYDSLINSHLQFCTTAWGYLCNRVTNLQKRALRIMCGAKYTAHTEPLLKGCNISKFEDIFKLSCLKLYHKYINRM